MQLQNAATEFAYDAFLQGPTRSSAKLAIVLIIMGIGTSLISTALFAAFWPGNYNIVLRSSLLLGILAVQIPLASIGLYLAGQVACTSFNTEAVLLKPPRSAADQIQAAYQLWVKELRNSSVSALALSLVAGIFQGATVAFWHAYLPPRYQNPARSQPIIYQRGRLRKNGVQDDIDIERTPLGATHMAAEAPLELLFQEFERAREAKRQENVQLLLHITQQGTDSLYARWSRGGR